MTDSKIQITIVGAGVTGLQTALSLLQTNKYKVTIVAQHFPGDLSIEYTSPWAGGHWRTHAGTSEAEKELREWDAETYGVWWSMLNSKGKSKDDLEKQIGLGIREAVMLWSGPETEETEQGGRGIWWRDVVHGFEILKDDELKAYTADAEGKDEVFFGVRYSSICINIPVYLNYLVSQVTLLGGIVVRNKISAGQEMHNIISNIKDIPGCEDSRAVVFATGLSSRHLFGAEEASKLYPIRGQTMLVKGELKKSITYYGHMGVEGDVMYIVPRPSSGGTIIGGCKQKGNWSGEVDDELTKRILDKAKLLVPELLNLDGEFEVLSIQVGLRPGREGGPRVELGPNVPDEDGVKTIFAYGHAGAGYQNSIGSAGKVVQLLNGLFKL